MTEKEKTLDEIIDSAMQEHGYGEDAPKVSEEPAEIVETPESPPVEPEKELPEADQVEPQAADKSDDLVAPATWTGAAKAAWTDLPDPIKREINRRELDLQRHSSKTANEAKQFEGKLKRYEESVEPVKQALIQQFGDEAIGLKSITNAWANLIDPNTRMGAFTALADFLGIDRNQLQPQPTAQPVNSEVEQLRRQIVSMQQQLHGTIESQTSRERLNQAQAFIDTQLAYKNQDGSPKYGFYNQLEPAMDAILTKYQANGMLQQMTQRDAFDRAYDEAFTLVRPDLHQKAREPKPVATRTVSTSVQSKPAVSIPSATKSGPISLDEAINAAMEQHGY